MKTTKTKMKKKYVAKNLKRNEIR